MEIKVCIGSACYVKGSHQVIEELQRLIDKYHLENEVTLKAAFCLGKCTGAVSVQLEDHVYSVQRHEVEQFFNEKVRGK